jgi:predicted transposase YdaD
MPFVVDLMENKVFQARYERGLAEGEAKGKAEGELKVLQAQMNKRFGELPRWAQERLERATTEQLETWSLKLLDAATLEEVLGKN